VVARKLPVRSRLGMYVRIRIVWSRDFLKFRVIVMTCQSRQAGVTPVCEPLETRIRRFPRRLQRRMRKFVKGAKELKELVYSFPVAALVLVTGNRPPEARALGLRLVKDGRPLVEVAAALDLPIWTRQVPPEALGAPFGALPDHADFNRRVVNLIPPGASAPAQWLSLVSFAYEACGEAMALWLAGQRIDALHRDHEAVLLPVAAFVWFSQQREETAFKLIGKPWQKSMGFRKVAAETRIWIERVILDYCFEDSATHGSWFKVRKGAGYRFVPLRTAAELRAEGDRMRNCLSSYARDVAAGQCIVYAIQRGNTSVATLEVVADTARPGRARVAQIEGPANTPAPEDVVRAAGSWIARQGRFPLMGEVTLACIPVREARWRRIWYSYVQAKPKFGAMLQPTPECLRRLSTAIDWLESCQ